MFTYYLRQEGEGGRVSGNPYARVRNQENHSTTLPYREGGGVKKVTQSALRNNVPLCHITYLILLELRLNAC